MISTGIVQLHALPWPHHPVHNKGDRKISKMSGRVPGVVSWGRCVPQEGTGLGLGTVTDPWHLSGRPYQAHPQGFFGRWQRIRQEGNQGTWKTMSEYSQGLILKTALGFTDMTITLTMAKMLLYFSWVFCCTFHISSFLYLSQRHDVPLRCWAGGAERQDLNWGARASSYSIPIASSTVTISQSLESSVMYTPGDISHARKGSVRLGKPSHHLNVAKHFRSIQMRELQCEDIWIAATRASRAVTLRCPNCCPHSPGAWAWPSPLWAVLQKVQATGYPGVHAEDETKLLITSNILNQKTKKDSYPFTNSQDRHALVMVISDLRILDRNLEQNTFLLSKESILCTFY